MSETPERGRALARQSLETAEPVLMLRLFGPFEARVNGKPLARLDQRRARPLLALLALRHKTALERTYLAEKLWGGDAADRSEALARLRQSLSTLKTSLGPCAHRLRIDAQNGTVQLNLSGLAADVDLLTFEAGVQQGGDDAVLAGAENALERAACCFDRGPLLDAEPVPGINREREREREIREGHFLAALERAAVVAAGRGDHDGAICWRRRALAVRPTREESVLGLMRALDTADQPQAALEVYTDLARCGGVPGRALTRLRDDLRARCETGGASGGSALPPARRRTAAPRVLPHPLTPFVDRTAAVGEVKALVLTRRFVTLIGTGGVGKTRLAIQVADEVAGAFEHGAWFVDLHAARDRDQVERAVLLALDLQPKPGASACDTIVDHLKDRALLLVLDNCEQAAAACRDTAVFLLGACRELRLLATSRQPLGPTGEVRWRVPSLALPAGEAEPHLRAGDVKALAALELFTARACDIRPDFTVTDRNVGVLARICRRLDGIPLALELAAARLSSLSLDALDGQLDQRFALLTEGDPTKPPRARTLRATLDWSWDLLSGPEQLLLRRLCVFAGGWTLEAAQAVCTGDDLAAHRIASLLAGLVDKSLVVRVAESPGANGGTTRYRLLETIQAYASERLVESGEGDRKRARHAAFFLRLAEEADANLTDSEQAVWLERLDADYPNLRAVLDGCVSVATTRAQANTGLGLRLCVVLGRFWMTRGQFAEGRKWLAALLPCGMANEARRTAPDLLLVRALSTAGVFALIQGDFVAARPYLEEGLVLARDLADDSGIAKLLNNLGMLAAYEERLGEARQHYEECLRRAEAVNDKESISRACNNLGNVATATQEYGLAKTYYERSLAVDRARGVPFDIAMSLHNLGLVTRQLEQGMKARGFFAESVTIRVEIEDVPGLAHSLDAIAGLAALQGRQTRAAKLFGAAEALREEIKMPLPPPDREEYDRYVRLAGVGLNENTFAAAWNQGRTMAWTEAVAYALNEDEP